MRPRYRKPRKTTNGYPIVIKLGPVLPEELSQCEEGAYEDEQALKPEERDRPLETHTYVVARRLKASLRIENIDEAEDVYYAVCSGTFQSRNARFYRAACKIADALRDVVRDYNPHMVAQWPAPWDKP